MILKSLPEEYPTNPVGNVVVSLFNTNCLGAVRSVRGLGASDEEPSSVSRITLWLLYSGLVTKSTIVGYWYANIPDARSAVVFAYPVISSAMYATPESPVGTLTPADVVVPVTDEDHALWAVASFSANWT